jgi:hypothetical protein
MILKRFCPVWRGDRDDSEEELSDSSGGDVVAVASPITGADGGAELGVVAVGQGRMAGQQCSRLQVVVDHLVGAFGAEVHRVAGAEDAGRALTR